MKQVVLHLDGDAFFASVEQALDPQLKGRPVMTGGERGIVCAFSYEAKAAGITRGMQTWKAKEICPELIVRNSNYRTYQIFGRRAQNIVRRYIPQVEEYGVDECFAIMPGATLTEGEGAARNIQKAILKELGVSYSIGVAPTKVLAKMGSKWKKPVGITVVSEDVREDMLKQLPVGKLWGIGRSMTPWFHERGIHSAYDLAVRDETWVSRTLAKPYLCMWAELRGITALDSGNTDRKHSGSIQKTETFRPTSKDPAVVWKELLKNITRACEKLRTERILARSFSVHLKTQQFTYRRITVALPIPTAYPDDIIAEVLPRFEKLFGTGHTYRATGITLWETRSVEPISRGLFNAPLPGESKLAKLYATVDKINGSGRRIALGFKPKKVNPMFRIPLLVGSAK